MKLLLTLYSSLFIGFFAFPFSSVAQSSFLGINLGSSWTLTEGSPSFGINESIRPSIHVGLAFEQQIWRGVSLGASLNYDPKNLKYDNTLTSLDQNPGGTVETRVTYQFLTLPIYFQAGGHEFSDWIGPFEHLYIEGGGVIALLAQASAENRVESVDFTDGQKRISGGLVAGMGLNIPQKDNLLKLGLRAMFLMSDNLDYAPLVGGNSTKISSLTAYLSWSWGL